MEHRHIIFVPGKNPKPEPELHHNWLWQAMIEGLRRVDADAAAQCQREPECFSLHAWNFTYYHHYTNIQPELPWIEKLLKKPGADSADQRDANSWHLKLNWLLYSIADLMPFIIRWLPGPACATVRETRRYFNNSQNVAHQIRDPLKQQIASLLDQGQKILLIGHSLGSVIAMDALWELTHLEQRSEKLDFMSLGSPLGIKFVQHRLLGHAFKNRDKYPVNIRHWINIAARGDVTALDTDIHDDFRPMLKLGLATSIVDHHKQVYNWYRNAAGLNAHRSYGYMVNDVVARSIADWWRANA